MPDNPKLEGLLLTILNGLKSLNATLKGFKEKYGSFLSSKPAPSNPAPVPGEITAGPIGESTMPKSPTKKKKTYSSPLSGPQEEESKPIKPKVIVPEKKKKKKNMEIPGSFGMGPSSDDGYFNPLMSEHESYKKKK